MDKKYYSQPVITVEEVMTEDVLAISKVEEAHDMFGQTGDRFNWDVEI